MPKRHSAPFTRSNGIFSTSPPPQQQQQQQQQRAPSPQPRGIASIPSKLHTQTPNFSATTPSISVSAHGIVMSPTRGINTRETHTHTSPTRDIPIPITPPSNIQRGARPSVIAPRSASEHSRSHSVNQGIATYVQHPLRTSSSPSSQPHHRANATSTANPFYHSMWESAAPPPGLIRAVSAQPTFEIPSPASPASTIPRNQRSTSVSAAVGAASLSATSPITGLNLYPSRIQRASSVSSPVDPRHQHPHPHPIPMRTSTENGRRPSMDTSRRLSIETTRRPSIETTRRMSSSSSDDKHASDDDEILEIGIAEDANPRYRPTMEDEVIVKVGLGTKNGASTPTASPKSSKYGYFAVYDGHGGRSCVDYIKQHLHKNIAHELTTKSPTDALQSAFLQTDAEMSAARQYQESGSTVAATLIRPASSRPGGRDLYAANVGDARAVIAVADPSSSRLHAVRITRDHCPTTPREIDRVRNAGGSVVRGRVNGQLAVSRAMGDHALKRSGVSAIPHQSHIPLTSQHKFMIVGCDGLWDVMTDEEAVNAVAGMNDANKMADKLVKLAMSRGTTDNVSVMAIRLRKS